MAVLACRRTLTVGIGDGCLRVPIDDGNRVSMMTITKVDRQRLSCTDTGHRVPIDGGCRVYPRP